VAGCPPVGAALKGHSSEKRLLSGKHAEVTDAVPAVGDRDGEIVQDNPGIVS
jgi:hypothetical protein